MKINTTELTGAALDWAVAKCEELVVEIVPHDGKYPSCLFYAVARDGYYEPSTDWAQGGPIIEREGISLIRQTPDRWVSEYSNGCDRIDHARSWGPTPLIAAMRCRVASKLGDEVDVPKELLK